jgi:type IV pilus assembly protein PilO
MGALRADRIWMLAGATVTVLLVVASWFLLISPEKAAKSDVENQISDTQLQLITLRKRIAVLDGQKKHLSALTATLNKKKTAIPSSNSGIPAFLNQLNKSGTDTNVTVTSMTVGSPVTQVNLPAVKALPITLAATGAVADLESFLDTLQTGQARAVLIQSAAVSANSGTGSADSSSLTISLTLEAFVTSTATTTTK